MVVLHVSFMKVQKGSRSMFLTMLNWLRPFVHSTIPLENRLLCKIDSEGKAKKVTGCSGVVVKDFGEEHEAYNVVLQHVKSQ
uniref:Uncharacterized protein n=1 Tax=Glycine max TaxID=3847 RepID=K7M5T0_SOYBN